MSSTATVEEMLKARGIPVSQPGSKEKKSAGGGGKAAVPLAIPKFVFQKPPMVPKFVATATPLERTQNAETLRQFKADVVAAMFDHVAQIRAIDGLTDEDERVTEVGTRKNSSDAIASMLSYEPPYRESAVLAYSDALVKTCPEFRGSVEATLKSLLEVGFLTEVGEGKGVRIYGKDYKLAKNFERNPEAKAVGGALSKLVGRTVMAGKARFEEDYAAIKAAAGQNQLTPANLKAGKEGRMLLETPDHQHRDRFYKGGILLLESSNGGQIRALDGVGGCQHVARLVAEAGAWIWNTQLGSERLVVNERLPEEVFRNVLILHGLIFRGIAAAEKAEAADKRKAEFKEQTAAERLALKALATLTPVEFFLFSRVGTTVLDPLGRAPFEIRSQKSGTDPTLVWDVIALVERDEQGRIRVAECPERLSGFFAKHREFVPAGEKFADVSWPLNVLLRMGYAQAQAAATPEEKAAAQAEVTQVEAAHKAAEVDGNQELAVQLAAGSGEDLSGVQIPDPNDGR